MLWFNLPTFLFFLSFLSDGGDENLVILTIKYIESISFCIKTNSECGTVFKAFIQVFWYIIGTQMISEQCVRCASLVTR